jgi:hypothetical protein
MLDDIDPATLARLVRVASWYRVSPARYTEIILNRAFDELVDSSPNCAYLVELP